MVTSTPINDVRVPPSLSALSTAILQHRAAGMSNTLIDQEWGIMEKPFHHPSGVLLVAQPLVAFRQRENAQSPRELGKQELGASWNPGKGTAPQPRLLG